MKVFSTIRAAREPTAAGLPAPAGRPGPPTGSTSGGEPGSPDSTGMQETQIGAGRGGPAPVLIATNAIPYISDQRAVIQRPELVCRLVTAPGNPGLE